MLVVVLFFGFFACVRAVQSPATETEHGLDAAVDKFAEGACVINETTCVYCTHEMCMAFPGESTWRGAKTECADSINAALEVTHSDRITSMTVGSFIAMAFLGILAGRFVWLCIRNVDDETADVHDDHSDFAGLDLQIVFSWVLLGWLAGLSVPSILFGVVVARAASDPRA